jgi:hypothetical protein
VEVTEMTITTASAALQEYDAEVFRGLSPFHAAKGSLAGQQERITELGNVICKHGLQDKVGVTLLHQHFPISADEAVVREFAGNVAYMQPRSAGDSANRVPYIWKLGFDDYGQACYYPLEFCEYPDHLLGEARRDVELIAASKGFLAEMAGKLEQLGLADVFGIADLRSKDGLTVADGQTLLETTDHELRRLTLEPVPQSAVEGIDSTQTLWGFSKPEMEATAWCVSHCYSHCRSHT